MMKFAAPNLHGGINTTIRMGHKWLQDAKVNDILCLCDMKENKIGYGQIQKIRHTTLDNITQEEIDDLACAIPDNTHEALESSLHKIYQCFNPNELAVITFTMVANT